MSGTQIGSLYNIPPTLEDECMIIYVFTSGLRTTYMGKWMSNIIGEYKVSNSTVNFVSTNVEPSLKEDSIATELVS